MKNNYGLAKVINPYGAFIRNSILSLVLFLTAVLSVATGFFGMATLDLNKNDDNIVYGISGGGTRTNPYLIGSISDWDTVTLWNRAISAWGNGKYFKQTATLDFSNSAASKWTKGTTEQSYAFSGSYDGQGYQIHDMYDTTSGTDYCGLFGHLYTAVIMNLVLDDVDYINKDDYIGGIAGRAYYSTLLNITITSSSSTIKGDAYTGGLLGAADYTNIIDCQNNGGRIGDSTYNGDRTGGLVGYANDIRMYMCSATATIYGEDYAIGGLVGYLTGSGSLIYNCWYDGSVYARADQTNSGTDAMGGIVGRAYRGSIKYCWADTRGFSLTNSAYTSQGVIIGAKGTYASVSNCVGLVSTYSIKGTAYPASTTGVSTTTSTLTMGNRYWAYYSYSWNFDAIWEDAGDFMKFKRDKMVVLKELSNSYTGSSLDLQYTSHGFDANIFTQASLTSSSTSTSTAIISQMDLGYTKIKAVNTGDYHPYEVTLGKNFGDVEYKTYSPSTLETGMSIYPDGFNTMKITDVAWYFSAYDNCSAASTPTITDGIDSGTTKNSAEWIRDGAGFYFYADTTTTGYRFDGWYKGGTGSRLSTSTSMYMQADRDEQGSYQARYIKIYSLILYDNCDVTRPTAEDGNDTDTTDEYSEIYDTGRLVTVTAQDDSTDYNFIGWYEYYSQSTVVSWNAAFSFYISDDERYIAKYKVRFVVLANTGGSTSHTTIWDYPGTLYTVTATPNNGYNFDYWDGTYFTSNNTTNPYTFAVRNSYKYARANFIEKEYYYAKLKINVETPTNSERYFFTDSYIKGVDLYSTTTSAMSSSLTKTMSTADATLQEIVYAEQGEGGYIEEVAFNASSGTDDYYQLDSVKLYDDDTDEYIETITGTVSNDVWVSNFSSSLDLGYIGRNFLFLATYKIQYKVFTDAHFETNIDEHGGSGYATIGKSSSGYVYVLPGDYITATHDIDDGYAFSKWEDKQTGSPISTLANLTNVIMPTRYLEVEGFTAANDYNVEAKTYINNSYESTGLAGQVSINGNTDNTGYKLESVQYDSSITLEITHQDTTKYYFVGWGTGSSYSANIFNTNASATFTFSVDADETYYAHFRQIYTVTLSADTFINTVNYYLTDGVDGDTTTSTSEKYLYGQSYTIYVKAYPTAPYVKILEGATTRYGYTSKTSGTHEVERTNIAANANFDIEYLFAIDLTVAGGGGGSISLTQPSYVSRDTIAGGHRYYFKGNETKTITAVPNATSTFDVWSGASSSTSAAITMDAGHTISTISSNIPNYIANFDVRDWTLTASEVTNGSISDTGGDALVDDGNDVDTTDEPTELVTYGTPHTLHVTNVNPGYEFVGWSLSSTGGAIIAGSNIDANGGEAGYQWVLSSMPNNDVTYYAVFEPLEYTLTVNIEQPGAGSVTVSDGLDGDTSDSTSELFKFNQTGISLDAPSSSTNYQFDGWYDGGAKLYAVTDPTGITYTWVGNKTLTAKYKIKHSFSVGAGSGTISPTSNYYTNGANITYTLSPSAGYEFDYWSGSTTGISNVNSSTATITAQNTPQSIVVNYTERSDINVIVKASTNDVESTTGGSVSGGGAATFNSTKTITATPNANYTFLGWAYTANGSIISGSNVDADGGTAGYQWAAPVDTATGETYYAKFYYNNYTITYVENGGTDLTNVSGLMFKSSYTLPVEGSNAGEIKKDGYNFEGWYKDAGFSDGTYTALTNISSNTTVYAKWGAVSYNVRAIAVQNGGSGGYGTVAINAGAAGTDVNANLQYLDGVTETDTLTATVTNANYDFKGWSTSPTGAIIAGSTTDDDGGTAGYQWDIVVPIGGITYYAIFNYNSFTISYVENGGNAVADETGIKYGDNVALATSADIYKDGYVFKGWTVGASDTGSYVTTATNVTSDLTFYAQWRAATNWQELRIAPATNYQIWTPEELAWFGWSIGQGDTMSGETWTIMADIDLNGDQFGFANDSIKWVPAGSYSSFYFSGTLDGNNKTIEDMYIDTTLAYSGLIAYIKNGEVKDLTMSSANVDSTQSAGILAGVIDNSPITNINLLGGSVDANRAGGIAYNIRYSLSVVTGIVSSANISSTSGYTGAISARMDSSRIYNSHTTTSASIVGTDHVGGLVGYMNNGGIISNSYNLAPVTAGNVGGIVGVMDNSDVNNCYNLGTITRTAAAAGGVIGYMRNGSTASSVYSSSTVTTNYGLVGTMQTTGDECSITNSYYDISKAGSGTNGVGSVGDNVVTNCTGLTTAQTKNQTYYSNFNFTDGGDWTFASEISAEVDNGGLPRLQAFNSDVVVVTFNNNAAYYDTRTLVNGSRVSLDNMPTDPSKPGYSFVGWGTTISNANFALQGAKSVTVSSDTTVYAVYDEIQYTVSVSISNASNSEAAGNSVDIDSLGITSKNYDYNTTGIDVIATDSISGYTFHRWMLNGSEVSTSTTYTFDLTLVQNYTFVAEYYVELTFVETGYVNEGVITPAVGTHNYVPGSALTVSGAVNPGYEISWTSGGLTGTSITGLSENITVPASPNTYTLNIDVQTGISVVFVDKLEGATSSVGGDASYTGTNDVNETITLSPNTNKGYVFVSWVVTTGTPANLVNNSYVIAPADAATGVTITANYARDTFNVQVIAGTGGSATIWDGQDGDLVDEGTETFYYLETARLTAVPDAGYVFDGWYAESTGGTALDTNVQYDVITTYTESPNSPESNIYYARFVKDYFTVTVTATSGGSALVEDGADGDGSASTSESFEFNTSNVTLTATKDAGYVFDGWFAENTGGTALTTNLIYDITVSSVLADNTYFARFSKDDFLITVVSDGNGTVIVEDGLDGDLVASTSELFEFETTGITITATPNEGYKFDGWYSDAARTSLVSALNPYSSVTVTSSAINNTYYAKFVEETYSIIVKAVTSGVLGSNGGTAKAGSDAAGAISTQSGLFGTTVDILADVTITNGYVFEGWFDEQTGGTALTTNLDYTVTIGSNIIAETNIYYARFIPATSWDQLAIAPSTARTITNAHELAYLGTVVNGGSTENGLTWTITSNINLNGSQFGFASNSIKWIPIGRYDSTNGHLEFRGILDGGNHTISDMYIRTITNYEGLFEYVYYGTVKNIVFTGVDIVTNYGAGAVAGVINQSTIENISVAGAITASRAGGVVYSLMGGITRNITITADITTTSDYAGGVAGRTSSSPELYNCYIEASASVTASSGDQRYVGGIAGYIDSGTIIHDSYNKGDIGGTNNDYVGGIVGVAAGNSSVYACYNEDNITGYQFLGGIAGSVVDSTIRECYNIGDITAAYKYVGGIAGQASNSDIYDCYSIADTAAMAAGGTSTNGGIVGYVVVAGTDIYNCYASGINSTESGVQSNRGILGYSSSVAGTVTNCYFDKTLDPTGTTGIATAGSLTVTNSIGLENVDLQNQDNLVGFDFASGAQWAMSSTLNGGMAVLQAFNSNVSVITFRNTANGVDWVDYSSKTIVTGGKTGVNNMPDVPTRTGYDFVGWGDQETSTTEDYVATDDVNASRTVFAVWLIKSFTATFNSNGGSAVDSIVREYGASFNLPSAPSYTEYYSFDGWLRTSPAGSVYSVGTSYQMVEDVTFTAQWIELARIVVTDDGHGSVTPIAGYYEVGSVIGLDFISADDGYEFYRWTKNGVAHSASVDLNYTVIAGDLSSVSTFIANTVGVYHDITVNQVASGAISPDGGADNVEEIQDTIGTIVFTVTPNTGYLLVNILVDGSPTGVPVSTGDTYTFANVTADHTITAEFRSANHTITVTQEPNGTITPDTTSVADGATQSFNVVPADGYKIASVTVDGGGVDISGVTEGQGYSYTFTNVTADHTITATYTELYYDITIANTSNGIVIPDGGPDDIEEIQAKIGSIKFFFKPSSGYTLSNLVIGGSTIVNLDDVMQNGYVVTNVQSDITVTATFTAMSLWTSFTTAPAGTGDWDDPYIINTNQKLAWVANETNNGNTFDNKYFTVVGSIDLSGKIWVAIGTTTNPFKGNVTGEGSSITNMYANTAQTSVGLFGHVLEAQISELILTNSVVMASNPNAGGIVGLLENSVIYNVSYSGVVRSSYDNTGGIVGRSENSYIINVINNADVYSESYDAGGIVGDLQLGSSVFDSKNYGYVEGLSRSGGIAGSANTSTLKSNANYGDVYASTEAGGIVGDINTSTLENCYNRGDVYANSEVGGIVGDATSATIGYSYSTGNIDGLSSNINGVAGRTTGTTITVSYYLENTVEGGNDATGYDATAAELQSVASAIFASYDKTNVWENDSLVLNDGYIALKQYMWQTTISKAIVDGTVVASAPNGDTVIQEDTIFIQRGEDQSFVITADSFYQISLIEDNGGGVAVTEISTQTYTLTNVTAEHNLYAEFARIKNTIVVTQGANGNITIDPAATFFEDPTDTFSVSQGDSIKFTITPNAGYKITSITTDAGSIAVTAIVGDPQDYTFIVSGNHTITATFELVTWLDYTTAPSGLGTLENPYLIYLPEELAYVAAEVKAGTTNIYATLMQDIDISAHLWYPIASELDSRIYNGAFEGNGYTINGLTISTLQNYDFAGLFGRTSGEVKNVTLTSVDVTGNIRVGGIAGDNFGTIDSCYVASGTITGYQHIGGIVGDGHTGSSVLNSANNATIVDKDNSQTYAGGIVGVNSGLIQNSYNTGTIGTNNVSLVGGITGKNYDAGASIVNSYNAGTVVGQNSVGGIAGENVGSITNAYNTGNVSGNSAVGGISGDNAAGTITNTYSVGTITVIGAGAYGVSSNDAAITNSYYLAGTVNGGNDTSGSEKTYNQLSLQEPDDTTTYVNWDFDETWYHILTENGDYPQLTYVAEFTYTKIVIKSVGSGSVTPDTGVTVVGPTSQSYIVSPNGDSKIAEFKIDGEVIGSYTDTDLEFTYTFTNVTGKNVLYVNFSKLYWKDFPSLPGGAGTEVSPYLISSPEELAWLSNFINAGNTGVYAVQTDNIPLYGKAWTAIGTLANPFEASSYDGDGYSITDMYIQEDLDYQGLFGYATNSTIRNVNLYTGTVIANDYIGGVVGYANNCSLNNIVSDVDATGNNYVGGIVGLAENNTSFLGIKNYGTVVADGTYVGGIVGYSRNSSIMAAVNEGNVNAPNASSVGGIIGGQEDTHLHNSYNIGSITADGNAGGITGELLYNVTSNGDDSLIADCYNVGDLTANYSIGGIVGYDGSNGDDMENTYYISTALYGNGVTVDIAGKFTKKTSALLKTITTYNDGVDDDSDGRTDDADNATDWDFHSWWQISAGINNGYPTLQLFSYENIILGLTDENGALLPEGAIKSNSPITQVYEILPNSGFVIGEVLVNGLDVTASVINASGFYTFTDATGVNVIEATFTREYWIDYADNTNITGTGTDIDPYMISTPEELAWITYENNTLGNKFTGSYFELDTNIPLYGKYWTPIGNNTDNFEGNFDGAGHSISNMLIEDENASYQGLFGYIAGADITDIRLVEPKIEADSYVGAFVGYANNNSSLSKLHATSTAGYISNVQNYAGGIVGYLTGLSSIINSSSVISVNATVFVSDTEFGKVGGIAGYVNNSLVSQVYNTGNISGYNYVGGVAGYLDGASTVENSYNRGNISAIETAGGTAAYVNAGTNIIRYTYNTGNISGSTSGAILGDNQASSTLNYNYFLTGSDSYGVGSPASSFSSQTESKTSGTMTTNHATNYVTWDFTTVWDTDPLANNDGYPTLRMIDTTLYTITTIYGENGIVTPGGATIFKAGADQDFYLIPNAGYYISSAELYNYVDEPEDLIQFIGESGIQTYSFVSIDRNYRLTVNFSAVTYAISVSTGTGGSAAPDGISYVNGGDNFSITITPNAGMEIDTLTLDGVAQEEMSGISGESQYIISNITENHSVYVSFRGLVYEVLSSVDGSGGTISPEGLLTFTQSGLSQLYTITPDEGYQITSLLVNDVEDAGYVGISEETTFDLQSISMDYIIVVSFEKSELTLTTTTGSNGSISPLGVNTVEYGSSVIVTATPDIGYKVKSFTVNGVSVDAYINSTTRITHTIDPMVEDTVIDVTYQSIAYTIDFTTNIANAGNPQYTGINAAGQTIALEANPYDGYTFSMWELVQGAGTLAGNNYTINASDITGVIIKAYYSAKTVNVNITTDPQGTIAGSSVDGNYSVGDDITLMVDSTNAGYEFSVWTTNVQRYDSVADELVDLEFTSAIYNYTITGEDVEYAIANNAGVIAINAEYVLEEYDITFNADNGEPAIQVVKLEYGVNVTTALGNIITPTKAGEGFNNWFTAVDGGGTVIGSYGNITGPVTFFADWLDQSTVVIMVADPVEGGSPEYTGIVNTGNVLTLTPNAVTGYTFTGWTVEGDDGTLNGNSYTVGTQTETAITITGHYVLQQFHIAFDANGGAPSPATINFINYGDTITLPTEPTKTDYGFVGWEIVESVELFNPADYIANTNSATYYEATATGIQTLASQDYRAWSSVGNYTLSANTQYRITAYNPDRAIIEIGDGTGYKYYNATDYYINLVINTTDSPLLLFKIDPSNAVAGVELSNISIREVNGFFSGATTVERDYNLLANWDLADSIVSFNNNGSAEYPVAENPADVLVKTYYSVDADTGANMPENPAREGHVFVKWEVEVSDGTNLIGDEFTSSTIIYGDLTVKAIWALNTYEINFYKESGDVIPYHTISNIIHDSTVTLPTEPIKQGYNFNGWEITENGAGDFTSATKVIDNFVITAQFTINIYTVTFDEDNGNATYTENVTYGQDILDSAMPADPTYYGYAFNHWEVTTGNANGNNVGDTFDNAYVVYEDITVTAQWDTVNYTVTFDTNGADPVESIQVPYLGTITLPTVTRLHYVAGGWTVSVGNVYGNVVDTVFTEATPIYGDITIQIAWTEVDYTITFNPDNTDSNFNIVVTYGLSINTDADVSWPADPEKAGYLFTGWTVTVENAYGNSLGSGFDNETIVYGDLTVTAIWDQATNWIELADGSGITGGGTSGSPFIIHNAKELAYLSALVISYPEITAGADVSGLTVMGNQSGVYWEIDSGATDIDLNSTQFGWSADTLQWTPIGSVSVYFAGMFNGNNINIKDMLIANALDNQGLFGIIADGAEVTNMYLTGVSVSAGENVGAITGQVFGYLNNADVYGSVHGTTGSVGGIAGFSNGTTSTLTDLYNHATVSSGGEYTGGIVGLAHQDMTGCINYGTVSGVDRYTGGITGFVDDATINNCSNDGTVTSTYQRVGGITGQAATTAIIQNSFNAINGIVEITTAIVGDYGWVGGIAGHIYGGSITNSYNAGTVTSLTKYFTAGIVGEMGTTSSVNACYTTADSSVTGLSHVGGIAGKQYLSDTSITNSYNAGDVIGETYVGGIIGTVGTGSTLDNNYTLSTSYVEVSVSNGGGIAGSNSTIMNGNYNQGTVTYSGIGRDIGGIAGRNSGTINNSYTTVTSAVSSNHLGGGIVGLNQDGGLVYQCYNQGTVNTIGNISGGIVADNFGTVNECFNSGTITGGGDRTGGIVGRNGDVTGITRNSYNVGTVNGTNNAGGVAGHNYNILENTYNLGTVTGTTIGGVVGTEESTNGLANNYFIDTLAISGIGNTSTSPAGEAESYTSTQLQSASNFNTWDFANIWGISDAAYNNGYPILRWQITINHTITASKVDDNGSITPDGIIISENPITQDYSMIPNANYKILSVLINGVEDVSFAGATIEQIYSFVAATGDNTIVVEFEVNSVIVTFNGNGADSQSHTEMEVVIGDVIDPLPTAAKLGYNFDNWNKEIDGTGDILFITTQITETVTYHAIFIFDGSITINSSYSAVDVPDANVYAFIKVTNTNSGAIWMYALQDSETIVIDTTYEGDYTIVLVTAMHHTAGSDVSGNAFSLSPVGTSQVVNIDISKTSSGYMYEILG